MSTREELALFEQAGPVKPAVDGSALVRARYETGPYGVVAGDILELRMPAVMRALVAEPTAQYQPHVCRVGSSGKITLPVAGEIDAAGKTLYEIENAVVALYHPQYCTKRPSVVATVNEHVTVNVAVTGAVKQPGVYPLKSSELSLVAALMKAGGIIDDGAAAVRIRRNGRFLNEAPIVLPVEGLNLAFTDVALSGGETVDVVGQNPHVFSVLGLVAQPGTFDYPPDARYTLLQAIAFARGLDQISDPRYVQVYRQSPGGEIVTAVFDLSGDGMQRAAATAIKPGDVVYVADTFMTMGRRALVHVLENIIRIGLYYNLNPVLGD